jgi:CO dehydrogenase nickel-insertion accessory protein CooC1
MEKSRFLINTRIGVFGKGGSGKSTAVALLAKALYRHGYQVCVIDADSTNIGLPQALGFDQPPMPLLDYFGGMIFSGGAVTCPVDDPTPLTQAAVSLDRLPRRYYAHNRDGITLLVAGKIAAQGPGAGCDGPVAKIARDFRVVQPEKAYITLIDFKAGFEDTARGVITGLDWALVIVAPTVAAVEMAVNMRDMVEQMQAGVLPATRHLERSDLVAIANDLFTHASIKGVLVVLNKIPNEDVGGYLKAKLAEKGLSPIGMIHEDTSIALSWLKGLPIDSAKTEGDVDKIIAEFEHLADRYSKQVDEGSEPQHEAVSALQEKHR